METESVMKSLPNKKSPELEGLTVEFPQIFQELTPILYKLFKTTEREAIFTNYFHEANITQPPKPFRDITEKENQDWYV